MAGEKTEQPTPQKLKKAKREGQIGRSQDVGAWFGMLAASIMLAKTTVLAAVLYTTTKDRIPTLMTAGQLPLGSLLAVVKDAVLGLVRAAAVAGIVMAAADYFVVRRRTNKQLRMTKEEVKQEYKNTEGDPHVKGQIRARQMAMARNRQMADVPTADVVLVNPTHVAVALRYEPTKGAPRVVAKGQGPVATKIRELAAEHRIPMVQDVPLARALHRRFDEGAELPAGYCAAEAKGRA